MKRKCVSGKDIVAVSILLSLICLALAAQDVQVNSPDHNAPNLNNFTTESETSIAKNGTLAVVGYNTSRQAGLLGSGAWTSLSGYAYSTNGGVTFTDAGFVPSGSYSLEGDPTLGFDRNGNLYYASLLEDPSTGASYIGVNQSTATSPSVTFGNPVLISGQFSTTGGFQDKELLAVDNTGGTYDGRVYVAWSEFPASGNPQAMLAVSSSTSPLTFSPSIELSPSSTSIQHGTFPLVGPDGAVYVAWSTLTSYSTAAPATVNLVKSTNGGASFSGAVTVASFTSTTADLGTGGMSLRTRSFPYLAADRIPAGSPTSGNLYAVFQAQPGTSATPRSEVFFTSSTDGGTTWSTPRNISSGPAVTIGGDSTNNDNWMPSISVSPSSGHIKVLFYSRREDPANQKIRVYEAGSTDGGMTWYNQPFSDLAFTPSVGYDPLLVSNYMGDYINAFADSTGLVGAWGDTRNTCAPPPGATAPCSPTGRGDQDAWSRQENDAAGVDMAITPWGYVTGVGPLWQTPDIYVVNSANVQVNAQKGVVNLLRAQVHNLGNADATGAVVRFRFAPIYASLTDSAFKLIGTATINAAAGSNQVVPINWDMTNQSDTNGGIWPNPISFFDHFCVRVDIAYPSDINLSNNDAQNNFFDVSTATGPIAPIHFLVANPLQRSANLKLVVPALPMQLRTVVPAPIIRLPKVGAAAGAPQTMVMRQGEIQVGTITLARPPASALSNLTHDLVININTVIDGKTVGGFSFLLAKANTAPPRPIPISELKSISRRVGQENPRGEAAPPQRFEMIANASQSAAREAIIGYLQAQKVKIEIDDLQRGLVSSGAIQMTRAALLESISIAAHKMVPPNATGKYFVTFHMTSEGAAASRVSVSTRIIAVTPADLDSPLGGRLVPSNGTIEQKFVRALQAKFQAR